MNRDTEILKQIRDELREMKTWLKLAGIPELRRLSEANLRDNVDKIVYELSDGERSTREIAGAVKGLGKGISHATVSNMWRRWAIMGLVEPSEKYRGRYAKVFPLQFLGIETPKILKKGD